MVKDNSTVQVLVQDQDGNTVTGKDGEVFLMNPTKMLFYHGQIDSDTGIANVTVAAGTYNYDVHLFGSAGEKGPVVLWVRVVKKVPGPGGEHFGPNDQPGGTPPSGHKEEDFLGTVRQISRIVKTWKVLTKRSLRILNVPRSSKLRPERFLEHLLLEEPSPGGKTSLPQGTVSFENGVKVTSYVVGAGTSSDTTTYLPTPPGIGNSVTVADGATAKKFIASIKRLQPSVERLLVGRKPMFAFVEVSNGDMMKELKGENFDSGDVIMSGGEANPQTEIQYSLYQTFGCESSCVPPHLRLELGQSVDAAGGTGCFHGQWGCEWTQLQIQ